MQLFEYMGDKLHKKSPPLGEEEDVTPAFREQANKALTLNAQQNKLGERSRDDRDYRISNQAELAKEIDTSKRMVSRILGPTRKTTKIKLVDRSVYVGRIRSALGLPSVTRITVRSARADVLRFIAELPDAEFEVFEAEIRRRMGRR